MIQDFLVRLSDPVPSLHSQSFYFKEASDQAFPKRVSVVFTCHSFQLKKYDFKMGFPQRIPMRQKVK